MNKDQRLLEEAYKSVKRVDEGFLDKAMDVGQALMADIAGWIPLTSDVVQAIVRGLEHGMEEKSKNLDEKTKQKLRGYMQELKDDLAGKDLVTLRELIRLIAKSASAK